MYKALGAWPLKPWVPPPEVDTGSMIHGSQWQIYDSECKLGGLRNSHQRFSEVWGKVSPS